MSNREEVIGKIQNIISGAFLNESEFYCKKCSSMLVDTKTAELIEEKFGGYCDICKCPDE
jgi:hypothetical protein